MFLIQPWIKLIFLLAQQSLTLLIDQAENYALAHLTPDQVQRRLAVESTRLPEPMVSETIVQMMELTVLPIDLPLFLIC